MKLSALLAVLTLAVVFAYSLGPPVDYDLWFDIRMGEEIVRTASVPHTTSFLGTQAQFGPYYSANDEWGFCLAVYLLYQLGGLTALSLGLSALLTVLFGILWASCRIAGLPAWATSLGVLGGFYLMRSRFMLRPHLCTDIFLALLVHALLRLERGGRRPRPWLALPFFVVWCNLHAGFMAGLVVLGVWTAGELISRPRRVSPRVTLTAMALASLAPFFTPGGWRLYRYLYHHFLVRPQDMDVVLEWQPPASDWYLGIQGLYLVVALVGFGLAARDRRLRWPHVGLCLLLFYASLRHSRALGELVAITVPLLAAAWAPRCTTRRAAGLVTAALLVVALVGHRPPSLRPEVYPEGALPYLQRVQGTILNAYHFGGWLTFHHLKPFVHGLTPTYPAALLTDYLAIMGDAQRRDQLLERYPVDALLLYYAALNDVHTAFLSWVAQQSQWSLVYWDDVCMLYLKSPQPDAYRALAPGLGDPFVGDLEQARRELDRKLAEDPNCVTAWKLQAELALKTGDLEGAVTVYRQMTERFAQDPRPWLGLGSALFGQGQLDPAEAALRRAIALGPNSATAHYNLALCLTARVRQAAQAGEQARAEEYLKQARREAATAVTRDPTMDSARKLLQELQR